MKTLKRLTLATALTLVVGLSALAGETQGPPCAPPVPGETQGPPCASAQMTPDDSAALDQAGALSASSTANEYDLSAVALDLVQQLLAIF